MKFVETGWSGDMRATHRFAPGSSHVPIETYSARVLGLGAWGLGATSSCSKGLGLRF